jgi:putative transposase
VRVSDPGRAAGAGDGAHFAESCCVVALGIDIEGNKHPLALVEGSTENATLVTDLLVGLRERGLDVTRPMLVGIDGSKALRKAVLDVLDRPVIQRCQLHKIRKVKDHLPQRLRASVGRKMTDAYHAASALEARPCCWPWPKNSTAPIAGRPRACAGP